MRFIEGEVLADVTKFGLWSLFELSDFIPEFYFLMKNL